MDLCEFKWQHGISVIRGHDGQIHLPQATTCKPVLKVCLLSAVLTVLFYMTVACGVWKLCLGGNTPLFL